MFLTRWSVLWPIALSTLLYIVTALVVSQYYQDHVPHYDSVAYYAYLFDLQNVTIRDGLAEGIALASRNSMSWLHSFYALPFSWLPLRAPWLLVSLNFVLLAIAQISILTYLRTTGAGAWRQAASIVLPLLPASMYVWDGGLGDLRRDCQYVLLLLALFFLGMAWSRAPSVRMGVALGLVGGFTMWSRDNAASGMVLVLIPIAATVLMRQGVRRTAVLALVPGLTVLAVAVPYLWVTAHLTWFRYNFLVWGIGEDRLESLATFWTAPLDVMRGGVTAYNGVPSNGTSSTVLYVVLGVALAVGLATRLIRLDTERLRQPWVWEIALAGLWIMGSFVAYNCLLLGYGARWHAMPFVPTAIGDIAVILALSNVVAVGRFSDGRLAPRAVFPALVIVLVVIAMPWRLVQSQYLARDTAVIDAMRAASLTVADVTDGKAMFQLWVKGFSLDHVNFYATAAGRPAVGGVDLSVADEPGQPFVLIQPLRPSDDPEMLREKLLKVAREASPYVLIAEEPSAYGPSDDAYGQFWLMAIGRPAIEELLEDPQFVKAARFDIEGTPLAILENRRLVTQADSTTADTCGQACD